MIDLALSNKREIVTDCGVITKADKGSDHRMIRIKIKINKKLVRVKDTKANKYRRSKGFGFDNASDKLEKIDLKPSKK